MGQRTARRRQWKLWELLDLMSTSVPDFALDRFSRLYRSAEEILRGVACESAKTNPLPMKTKTFKILPKLFGVALIAALSFAPRANAVSVTFSGGSGTPLSFTLTDPITYLITASAATAPFFIFQNTGNFGSDFVTGNITYTINAGSPQSISQLISGASAGAVTPNDAFLRSATFPGVSIGDTVILSAGTVTTNSAVAAAAPPSGMYNTFISDGAGNPISGPGISSPVSGVPDSLSTLWLCLPLAGMFAAARLRRLAAA